MVDTSKLPISRVDELIDKLDEINIKLTNLENSRRIIETWSEGTEWYRVWSDGWIEQGGRVTGNDVNITINFKKPYTTINYTITQAEIGHTGQDPYVNGYTFQQFTTNSVVCCMRNNGQNTCMWYVCGY